MKTMTQFAAAVKKATSMVGVIKRRIEKKMKNIVTTLYRAMVHSHLEYHVYCFLFAQSQKGYCKLGGGYQRTLANPVKF